MLNFKVESLTPIAPIDRRIENMEGGFLEKI